MGIFALLILLTLADVIVGVEIRMGRAADKGDKYRWPGNIVRVIINTRLFDKNDVAVIKGAMEEYEQYSCIKFQEIKSEEMKGDFIIINKGVGCYSITGRAGGQQNLELTKKCISHERLLHYLGHAIGMNHENVRPDRDEYITVHIENIEEGKDLNFNKMNESQVDTFGIPYDYGSIMHLGTSDFAKNGTVTITAKNGMYDDKIGKALHPSFRDWKLVNYMYSCNQHCDDVKTCSSINMENYLDKNCVCICPGPSPNQTTIPCSEIPLTTPPMTDATTPTTAPSTTVPTTRMTTLTTLMTMPLTTPTRPLTTLSTTFPIAEFTTPTTRWTARPTTGYTNLQTPRYTPQRTSQWTTPITWPATAQTNCKYDLQYN